MWNNHLKRLAFLIALVLFQGCQTMQQNVPDEKAASTQQAPAEVEKTDVQSRPADDLFQQAISFARADKSDDAIAHFQKLIELEATYAKAYTNLGLLFLHQEKYEAAEKALLTAIDQDKNDAIAYNHLAIIERQRGNFEKSKNLYLKAIDADPKYAKAYLNLGILLDIYLQDLNAALVQYKTYQELTENSDKTVAKWVLDIQRRITAKSKKADG